MAIQIPSFLRSLPNMLVGKVVILALMFVLTGILGLALAPEDGVNTIVWPPAGIALGMMLMCGWRLWPGVFIGAGILAYVHGADVTTIAGVGVICYAGFAATMQALVGYFLVTRFAHGRPIRLESVNHILWLLILAGPISSLVLPGLHGLFVYFMPEVAGSGLTNNFIGVWISQVVGIWVFMTLVFFVPCSQTPPLWKDKPLTNFTALALLVLLVPIGLTFYGWKVTVDNAYTKANLQFKQLTLDGHKALQNRVKSYEQTIRAVASFVESSQEVKPEEWARFVKSLGVEENFKGIQALAWVEHLTTAELAGMEAELKQQWGDDIRLEIAENMPHHGVVTHVAPLNHNRLLLGYDIFNSKERAGAAKAARDSGGMRVSRPLNLMQNVAYDKGFAFFQPIYKDGMYTQTPAEKREAIRGWVYAPVVAYDLFKVLTSSQGNTLDLSVYFGHQSQKENLIYTTLSPEELKQRDLQKQRLAQTMHVGIYGQNFTLKWRPTDSYMQLHESYTPIFVLVGGLTFTLLLGMFLMVLIVRDADTMNELSGERKLMLPLLIFLVGVGATLALYENLVDKERLFIERLTREKIERIENFMDIRINEKLRSLQRLSRRWEAQKRSPDELWRKDVRNYINDHEGMRAIQWVDDTYRLRRVEPETGNEQLLGLDVRFDDTRRRILENARQQRSATISPPILLKQGYVGILAYFPVFIEQNFDGFIVGLFDVKTFFADLVETEAGTDFALDLSYKGKVFYENLPKQTQRYNNQYASTRDVVVYDKVWQLHIAPTYDFIRAQRTPLPYVVLILGFVVAGLISLTVRYALLSRVRTYQQRESEERFKSAMNNASIGMALVSPEGKWLAVNKALCNLLGYSADELEKIDFQTITHADDLDKDLKYVYQMIDGVIDTYQMEKRYIHKKGYTIWALLSVSAVYDAEGEIKHFISQIQDITDRKEVDEMKSTFISTVSHELRTPLTSIRGSLGLVLGTLASELTPKVQHLLEIAHKNSERLILLINDILDLDKITAGKMRFDMADFNLRDLIAEALEVNAPYAQKNHVKMVASDVSEKLKVHVDEDRFQQVMSNLLSNAAKFSPEDDVIRIDVREDGNMVEVAVIDNGPGIPVQFQSHIFEKFSQADGSMNRQKSGTGLGLHISRELITKMGGQIGFDSEEGKGARFWIRLPQAGKTIDMAKLSQEPIRKPAVLHIDEDGDYSQLLQTALADKANIISVSSLAEAHRAISKNAVGLVLLDTYVRGENTRDFITQLTQGESAIPVVVLTSREPSEEIHEKAHAIMIKSKVNEQDIVNVILDIFTAKTKEKSL